MDEVLVIVGSGVVADAGLLAQLAEREFGRLGVRGRSCTRETRPTCAPWQAGTARSSCSPGRRRRPAN
ncbi:hypothetical protein ACFQYP_09365 [Nonomuraea antimicrobica]